MGRDPAAGKPGCAELVRRIDSSDAEIARLRLLQQPRSGAAATTAHSVTSTQGMTRLPINLVRALAAKSALAAEQKRVTDAAKRDNNWIVPACILVGIHESHADPRLKATLLQDFADSEHSELPEFMDAVCAPLRIGGLRPIPWVHDLLEASARLAGTSGSASWKSVHRNFLVPRYIFETGNP